jgi:hypothetical protein
MTKLKTALCELAASFLAWNVVESAVTPAVTASADFTTSVWNEAESRTMFTFQPVVPYGLWSIPRSARLILPYPVVGMAERERSNPSTYAFGPAAGFVVPLSSVVTAGWFTPRSKSRRGGQSLFSERTQLTQLQPLLAYQPGAGWSVSAGDLQIRIDWAKGRLSKVPIGVQLGVVCPVFEQPIRFFVSPQYDLKDVPGTDRFKVLVGIALLTADTGHN